MEKQLKDKKAALAMAEAKGPEEQDDLSSVSSTDVLVGGQAPTFDLSFLPNFLDQELSEPMASSWKPHSLPATGARKYVKNKKLYAPARCTGRLQSTLLCHSVLGGFQ
jgi:hypothetical protein